MASLTRTLKLQISLTPSRKAEADRMMRASAWCYNILVEQLRYRRDAYRKLKEEGVEDPAKTDPYCNVGGFWAWETLRTFGNQESCTWPREIVIKTISRGKRKGEEETSDAVQKNSTKGYGIPAQSASALARDFEAKIKGYFAKKKKGDHKAKLPRRFASYYPIYFSNQIVQVRKDGKTGRLESRCKSGDRSARFILGTGGNSIELSIPELVGESLEGGVRLCKNRSNEYFLHVPRKHSEPTKKIDGIGAVDFGQKRAMALSFKRPDGRAETAIISGRDICGLKREREQRFQQINHTRWRAMRGRMRQYFTKDDWNTYNRLCEVDQQRAAKGLPPKGDAIKFAHRAIAQKRRQGIDGKGRTLVDLDQQQPDKKLRKRSRRDWKLLQAQQGAGDYYQKRLAYANHCVTRKAADWFKKRKVGLVYVGEMDQPNRPPTKKASYNNRCQSLWEWPTQEKHLADKLQQAGGEGTVRQPETLTSRACPKCGKLNKPHGRTYHCRGCGWKGDRDSVGAANQLSTALHKELSKIVPKPPQKLKIAPAKPKTKPRRLASGGKK